MPSIPEDEQLANDLLPIVCMLPFLERGQTLNPTMYPKLVEFIRQYAAKAERRGYNTGFQKAKRIGIRPTKVVKQLRELADKLEDDNERIKQLEEGV